MTKHSLPPGFMAGERYDFGGAIRANCHAKGEQQDISTFDEFEEGVLMGVEQDAGLLVFEGTPRGGVDPFVFYISAEDCSNATVLPRLAAA